MDAQIRELDNGRFELVDSQDVVLAIAATFKEAKYYQIRFALEEINGSNSRH